MGHARMTVDFRMNLRADQIFWYGQRDFVAREYFAMSNESPKGCVEKTSGGK
jgi:hypothetical protein